MPVHPIFTASGDALFWYKRLQFALATRKWLRGDMVKAIGLFIK